MAMARCPAQSWHLCPWNLGAAWSTWPSFRNLHQPPTVVAPRGPGRSTVFNIRKWSAWYKMPTEVLMFRTISRRYCKSTVYSLLNKDCIFSFKSVTHLFTFPKIQCFNRLSLLCFFSRCLHSTQAFTYRHAMPVDLPFLGMLATFPTFELTLASLQNLDFNDFNLEIS